MISVQVPAIPSPQEASWLALLEIAKLLPSGWTLVGGQLVQLHCWERGMSPARATDDVDAVLDIQTDPLILNKFTSVLEKLGFIPQVSSADLQYKWRKAPAEIDILLPDHSGERAVAKIGVSGGSILETPGGRRVLDFSEKVLVHLAGNIAVINRPNLLGALFVKSKALGNVNDPDKDRHLLDLAVLATLFKSEDLSKQNDPKVISEIRSAIGRVAGRQDLIAKVDGAFDALQRLAMATS